MVKSSIKIITAGMVGGVLSFGLTSTIKPKKITKIEETNHQTHSAKSENTTNSSNRQLTQCLCLHSNLM